MSSWSSYPKIHNIGHPQVSTLFEGPVVIEEKVDGSQFSFGIFDGVLKCRSKGQELVLDAPEKMFIQAVEVVKELAPKLVNGWTYRAEYLKTPKHNTLAYDRIPEKHLIIFDVCTGVETYLEPHQKQFESARLGLECVPTLADGWVTDPATLRNLLEKVSVLGGQKIEGVVVKNYAKFTKDDKVMLGKHVSEAFKEIHQGEWRKEHPTGSDIKTFLISRYRTPARWNKAVQHLTEAGKLENSPKDIGALMKEVPTDIEAEYADEIKQHLWDHFWPDIKRGVIAGLPEWYKQQLLESAFKK